MALEGPLVDNWLASLPTDVWSSEPRLLQAPVLQRQLMALTNPEQFDRDPCGWAWSKILYQTLGIIDGLLREDVDEAISLQVRSLIDAQPARPWSLASIAGELHVSERTLSRLVQQETQHSVMQWVRLRRSNWRRCCSMA